jgi:sugar fermentation stimulation protein A
LETLRAAREEGAKTAVVFIIQRPDATAFAPHETADPAFAAALRRAAKRGVAVRAFTCRVSRREIKLAESVPVRLGDR